MSPGREPRAPSKRVNRCAQYSCLPGYSGNIGAEVTYLVTPRYGVTGFLRYAGATAEFDGVEGRDLKVGGVHLGVGFRYRF